jgi:hypothetical protein
MYKKPDSIVKQIVDGIHKCAKLTSPDSAFRDWVAVMAIAIQNGCIHEGTRRWKDNEACYMAIVQRVGADIMQRFAGMFALFQDLLELQPFNDWLGIIYMTAIGGDSKKGQFFTPYHVSLVCAEMTVTALPDDDSPITINEPTCGSGGMIVAELEVLHKRGINYQQRARIVASDIDTVCVHMCYVTLSLLGVRAKVYHQNTLTLETWAYWFTPREILWPIMDCGFGTKSPETVHAEPQTIQTVPETVQNATESTETEKPSANTSETQNAPERKSGPIQRSLF